MFLDNDEIFIYEIYLKYAIKNIEKFGSIREWNDIIFA